MTEASTRRPADSVELIDTLAYALLYDGKKRVHHADDVMARVTAEYLIRHLARRRQQPSCHHRSGDTVQLLRLFGFMSVLSVWL